MSRSTIFSRSKAMLCCLSLIAVFTLSILWHVQSAHALVQKYACYDVAVYNDPGVETIGILRKGQSFVVGSTRSGDYTFGHAASIGHSGWVKTVALCSSM